MRILFFGTPDFALESLKVINKDELVGVVTQADKPAGRGRSITPCPVAAYARERGIPVYQPSTLKDPQLFEEWKSLAIDLMVVVAYGRILPQTLLDIPRLGTINVHASLLPKYRGAAPIQRALMAGETETGVTTMQVEPELDAGPMILKRAAPILPDDTAATLHDRLAALGAQLLTDTLNLYRRGTPKPIPQDPSQASYAPPLKKEDGVIHWQDSATAIHNRIRGVTPWPGAWTQLHGKKIKITRANVSDVETDATAPGTVVHLSPQAIEIACGSGVLATLALQLEGKRALPVRDFVNGFPVVGGDRFE